MRVYLVVANNIHHASYHDPGVHVLARMVLGPFGVKVACAVSSIL